MSSEWCLYRHKKRPDIRYYVEMYEGADGGLRAKIYHARPGYPEHAYKERLVRLKAARNVRFGAEDFSPEMAPEAGKWPAAKFLELYEKEDA